MITLHLIAAWTVDVAGIITLVLLALWGLLIGIAWLRDFIRRPLIALPGNRCLVRFVDDEDRQSTLARLVQWGWDASQCRGYWYMVKRPKNHKPPPARKPLPSIPIDTDPRRGID